MSTLSKVIPTAVFAKNCLSATESVASVTVTLTTGWGKPKESSKVIDIDVPYVLKDYFNENVIVKWQRCGRLLILRDRAGFWLRRAQNVGDMCFGVSLSYYLYGYNQLRRAKSAEPYSLDYTLTAFSTKRMVELNQDASDTKPDIYYDQIQRFHTQEIENDDEPHSSIKRGIFFHEMYNAVSGSTEPPYSDETTPVSKVPATRNMPKRVTSGTIAVYADTDEAEERLDDLENAMSEMVEANDTVVIRGIEFSITDARKLLGIV